MNAEKVINSFITCIYIYISEHRYSRESAQANEENNQNTTCKQSGVNFPFRVREKVRIKIAIKNSN